MKKLQKSLREELKNIYRKLLREFLVNPREGGEDTGNKEDDTGNKVDNLDSRILL